MKLRHKFTLTIISASLVLAVAFIGFFSYWSRVEVENKISRTFFLRDSHITDRINLHFQERISNLEDIAEYTEKNINKKSIKEITTKFYEFRNLQKVFQNIKLYEMDGKKVVDTNGIRLNRVFDLQNIIPQSLRDQTSYFYSVDPETRIKVISFNRLILDEQKNPVAIIVADLPLASISNLVRSLVAEIQADDGLSLELLKENGEILYSNYNEEFLADEIISKSQNKKANNDERDYIFFQDEKAFYSVSKSTQSNVSQGANWHLVIKLNKDIAFKSINEGRLILIIVTLFIMLIFLLISYRIVSTITQPMEKASLALVEMGNGNFEPILSVKVTNDEYGELISGLQSMTKRVDLLIKEQVSEYRMAALGNMASNIAHEINNPLHLINNHVNLLKKMVARENIIVKDATEAERVSRSLNTITDTVMRISKIIVGMKALSRDGTNDQFNVCELSSILDGTLTLCEAILKNREIKLQIDRPIDDCTIECRSVQIQQVLLNLINNAADAIADQDNKWIEIKISENESEVRFEIINSGEKISQEIAENIFTPFYTTKSQRRGTGLGLSISKSIIDSHHGIIGLDFSNSHTCFTFKIPKYQKIKEPKAVMAA